MIENSKIKFELVGLGDPVDDQTWRVLKETVPGLVVSFGLITQFKKNDPYHLVIPNLVNMIECELTIREWQEVDEFIGQLE